MAGASRRLRVDILDRGNHAFIALPVPGADTLVSQHTGCEVAQSLLPLSSG